MRKKVVFEFSHKRVEIELGAETIERQIAYADGKDEEVENAITARIYYVAKGKSCQDTYYYEDEGYACDAFEKVVSKLASDSDTDVFEELCSCKGWAL